MFSFGLGVCLSVCLETVSLCNLVCPRTPSSGHIAQAGLEPVVVSLQVNRHEPLFSRSVALGLGTVFTTYLALMTLLSRLLDTEGLGIHRLRNTPPQLASWGTVAAVSQVCQSLVLCSCTAIWEDRSHVKTLVIRGSEWYNCYPWSFPFFLKHKSMCLWMTPWRPSYDSFLVKMRLPHHTQIIHCHSLRIRAGWPRSSLCSLVFQNSDL